MIKINLVKSQVPTKIDVPKNPSKGKLIFTLAIIALILIIAITYKELFINLERTINQPLTVKSNTEKKLSQNKKILPKKETRKKLEKSTYKSKKTKKIPKNTQRKEKQIYNPKKINKLNTPVLSISLTFKNATITNKHKKVENSTFLPLPKEFSVKPLKKHHKKNTNPAIYVITVKTTKIRELRNILRKFNINQTKIHTKLISTTYVFDVYVGGIYDYSKALEFYSILKKKGYKTFNIINIKDSYYILIDKNVDTAKMKAYKKVWSKTPFKIYFKPIKKSIFLYIVRFSSPSKKLIKILKKHRFKTIIKTVINGA